MFISDMVSRSLVIVGSNAIQVMPNTRRSNTTIIVFTHTQRGDWFKSLIIHV